MWLGVAITGFFVWLVLRDVSLAEVGRAIARAHWGVLLALSIPAYLATVWLRALRWRHLTEPIQPMAPGSLFRAVAVGFTANNIFPLRMGEVVRAWYLARETGASTAAIFGTVVLERVIDAVAVVAMAFGALWILGSEDGGLSRGALALVPAAAVPLLGLVTLKLAPGRVIALAGFVLRPFPARLRDVALELLGRFAEGLGALRGGAHLVWIFVHTVAIWLLVGPLPMLAGFLALGIDFGSPVQAFEAAWVTLAAIGVAVALPSAPGFFGTYHQACKLALAQFGVDRDTAVALGTLFHAVFWVTLTLLGLFVLRLRGSSLGDIEDATGPPSP